ncbi:MAG: HEAT repeat domain-containing protein [Candidatus Micrarchaeota archaeon]|nr:HEAT repeat domain-containing protein [Candidatus Micrarchaeota archaeon]
MAVDQTQINKLVSLTFDENPKVRKEAAKSLGEIDDPAALFALVELSYDKDISVKNIAQNLLHKKKENQQDVMSFAEMFSAGEQQEVAENAILPTFADRKEKVLYPITQIFEKRLGKEKAEMVRNKMMPAIEKVYMRITANKQKNTGSGKQAIQEFLTSYLEAISDLDTIAFSPTVPNAVLPQEQHQPVSQQHASHQEVIQPTKTLQEHLVDELGEVATKKKELGAISKEVEEIEAQEVEEQKEEEEISNLPQTFFKKSYETMMLSGGDDRIMRSEMKRMMRDVEKDLKLAYSLARKKFKELKITHISKIRDGMTNINTDLLVVKKVENQEYPKGKIIKKVTRLIVNDEDENEGVLYLFDDRGLWLKEGMKIKLVKGQVKSFKFSGETALTTGPKGSVNIIL